MTINPTNTDLLEFKLLLEAILHRYGYDFRSYAEASLRRRVNALLQKTGIPSISMLQHEVLHDPAFFSRSLGDLTVKTSEMFRDPNFFKSIRENIVPVLRTFPTFKVWHAGCSSGEEVHSLAILLHEEGLADKVVTYATDINPAALAAAKEGIYPASEVRRYTENYQRSGGLKSFSDYYTAAYGSVRFAASLRDNIVFADHNLVADEVFTEAHLIICRNVMIYFNRDLQSRVLNLFMRSLAYKGYLCLGSKESVQFLTDRRAFQEVDPNAKIYRKITRDASHDRYAYEAI